MTGSDRHLETGESDLRREREQEIGLRTYAHQRPDGRAQEDTSFARERRNVRQPGVYAGAYKTLQTEVERRSRGASRAYRNIHTRRSEFETERKGFAPGWEIKSRMNGRGGHQQGSKQSR